MELKPIRNKKEHQAALREIEALWNAKDDGTCGRHREHVRILPVWKC